MIEYISTRFIFKCVISICVSFRPARIQVIQLFIGLVRPIRTIRPARIKVRPMFDGVVRHIITIRTIIL